MSNAILDGKPLKLRGIKEKSAIAWNAWSGQWGLFSARRCISPNQATLTPLFRGCFGKAIRQRAAQTAALNKSQAVIEFDTEGNVLTANQNFLATVRGQLLQYRRLAAALAQGAVRSTRNLARMRRLMEN